MTTRLSHCEFHQHLLDNVNRDTLIANLSELYFWAFCNPKGEYDPANSRAAISGYDFGHEVSLTLTYLAERVDERPEW